MRVAVAALLVVAAACSREPEAPAGPPPPVQIGPESTAIVAAGELEAGPLVSGTLRPAVEATLRAEVSGTVLTVPEMGTKVTQGQVVVTFDPRALRDAHRSAQLALRSARLAETLAGRDAERYRRLASAGAIAPREAETAQTALAQARAAVAQARANVASAQSRLEEASVRSPFAGVVSQRSVKAGDIVQPGTPLTTVIDPASMRLEADVPAMRAGEVAAGQRVDFRVTGYGDRVFTGTVERVSPTTDPATGQVAVTAVLPGAGGTIIGGLHADGRILTRRQAGLIAPLAAIDRRRLAPEVLRLREGVVERVRVTLGLLDDVNERVLVVSGLAVGDVVLVGAAKELAPGTRAEVTGVRAAGS